jgi:hypothetical protein
MGPTEITRRVSASGLIGVCYQQVSAGRHLAGQVVTVRLHPTVLQVFLAGQLIRTVPRRSTRRSSNSEPTDPTSQNNVLTAREVSTITRNQTRKHQPELDALHGRLWHERWRHRPTASTAGDWHLRCIALLRTRASRSRSRSASTSPRARAA